MVEEVDKNDEDALVGEERKVLETFNSSRWPNMLVFGDLERGIIVPYVTPFSDAEITRRQDLVRAKLRDMECDLLIAQCWFPTATFASQSTMYWLSGFNGFRNTMTLIRCCA